jgi:hypothetical protein
MELKGLRLNSVRNWTQRRTYHFGLFRSTVLFARACDIRDFG